MTNLHHKYNQPETVLMVSLYPKKGELYSSGTSGVASYAKNVATRMETPVVVLADRENRPHLYEEGNVLVNRCFHKGKFGLWLEIFRQVLNYPKAGRVIVQFDFGMYGSLMATAMILPFLFLMKLLNKRTFVVSHHVITDVFKLKGHVGLGDGMGSKLKGNLYNGLFRSFYMLLSLLVEKIVVLEEPLKKMLGVYVPEEKVMVINHGVDTSLKPISKRLARRQLYLNQDSFIILFFGFVNWFKGADFFAETFKNSKQLLHKNVLAVIAGGESPTMKSKGFYQKFYNKVTKTVSDSPVVNMTGYIKQEDLVKYFSAADLLVFPYRHFMTASGVMSLALSYGKPFIVSRELSAMFEGSDFKKTLSEVGLRKTDITFHLSKRSCLNTSENVLKNGIKGKLAKLSRLERERRDYAACAREYDRMLESAKSGFWFGEKLLFQYNEKK